MATGFLIHVVIIGLVAVLIVCVIVFVVIDMFGRVDYLKDKAPWIAAALERRSAVGALLLVAIFLLVSNGYELVQKEVPEIAPPSVTI
jgi:hypothetical protein